VDDDSGLANVAGQRDGYGVPVHGRTDEDEAVHGLDPTLEAFGRDPVRVPVRLTPTQVELVVPGVDDGLGQ